MTGRMMGIDPFDQPGVEQARNTHMASWAVKDSRRMRAERRMFGKIRGISFEIDSVLISLVSGIFNL